jgi:hypothetical protein
LAKQAKTSRAALIRDAIDAYLEQHRRRHVEDGFGLWGQGDIDGLAYQERIREEW